MSQTYVKKGMLLCAGLGTRLLPVTETLPKPLVPILNIENILFNIQLLQLAGVEELIVNLHHLPEPLEQFLKTHPAIKSKIHFSREPTILGTGGGVKKAESFFDGAPFVLANCDFVTDIDLESIIIEHQKRGNLATMVLIQDEHRQRKYSRVGLDTRSNICSLPKLETKVPAKQGIFTGIHIIEAECLRYLKNEPCGINDLMYPALMKAFPTRVGAVVDTSHFWFDTGEVDTCLASSAGLLAELSISGSFLKTVNQLLPQHITEYSRGVWISNDLDLPPNVRFHGNSLVGSNVRFEGEILIGPNVVIGDDCKILGPAKLSDCIVFKGSTIQRSADLRECLVYQNYTVRSPPAPI